MNPILETAWKWVSYGRVLKKANVLFEGILITIYIFDSISGSQEKRKTLPKAFNDK